MPLIFKKKGLSLIEIVVALVIISIAILGVTHLFIGTKIYLRHSRCRIQAVNLAKWYLEELALYVRADHWQGGDYIDIDGRHHPLKSGLHDATTNDYIDLSDFYITYPPIRYKFRYLVSGVDGIQGLRRVRFEVRWIEPQLWRAYIY